MSPQIYRKKIFAHGGSKAVNLPKEARFDVGEVLVEVKENGVFIYADSLTSMELDPRFQLFVEAIFEDAMNNPHQLKDLKDIWDDEWDELLRDVNGGNET